MVARVSLHLAADPDADALISRDPLALLIGMVLDQQVPLEKAFRGPVELERRLGRRLDAAWIAAMDPGELAAMFSAPPALHRFPGSMAGRVQALCRVVVDEYHGDAASIWTGASRAEDLFERVKALPGFADRKARIFVALLGKQLGVKPEGWREVSTPFGEHAARRSVADIVDTETLTEVRAWKAAAKAKARAAGPEGRGPAAARKSGPAASSRRARKGA